MNSQLRICFCALLIAGAVGAAGVGSARADDTGFASMHDWKKIGGRTCFASHFHAGHGTGKTKQQAFKAALKDWWSYTAGEYGSDWARWSRSAKKGIKYTKESGGWAATVESLPCK